MKTFKEVVMSIVDWLIMVLSVIGIFLLGIIGVIFIFVLEVLVLAVYVCAIGGAIYFTVKIFIPSLLEAL